MLKKVILTIAVSLISFASFANGFAGLKYGVLENHKIEIDDDFGTHDATFNPNSFGIYGGIEQQDMRFFGEYNFKATDLASFCSNCYDVKAGFSSILVGADYMIEVMPKGKILLGGVTGIYQQTWEDDGDGMTAEELNGLALALNFGYKYDFNPISIEVGYRYGLLTGTFPGEKDKKIDGEKVTTKLAGWNQLNVGVSYNFNTNN